MRRARRVLVRGQDAVGEVGDRRRGEADQVGRGVVVEVADAPAAVILDRLEDPAMAVEEAQAAAVVVLHGLEEVLRAVAQLDPVAEAVADRRERDALGVGPPWRALEQVDEAVAGADEVALVRQALEQLEDAARRGEGGTVPAKHVLVQRTCPAGHVAAGELAQVDVPVVVPVEAEGAPERRAGQVASHQGELEERRRHLEVDRHQRQAAGDEVDRVAALGGLLRDVAGVRAALLALRRVATQAAFDGLARGLEVLTLGHRLLLHLALARGLRGVGERLGRRALLARLAVGAADDLDLGGLTHRRRGALGLRRVAADRRLVLGVGPSSVGLDDRTLDLLTAAGPRRRAVDPLDHLPGGVLEEARPGAVDEADGGADITELELVRPAGSSSGRR
jgi:hypothetical protein